MKTLLTDSAKKTMNKKQKLERMAEKKAAYETHMYSDDQAECRFHGFIHVNCKVCIASLKRRLAIAPAAPAQPSKE